MNYRSVLKVLAFLLLVTAACLLLPGLVSALYGDGDWPHFLVSAGLGALIGGGVGAIFGGSRGAVAGVIVGGVLGGMSKRRKRGRW